MIFISYRMIEVFFALLGILFAVWVASYMNPRPVLLCLALGCVCGSFGADRANKVIRYLERKIESKG